MNDPTRRTGIFGGTFDPVHCGHLLVAEQARDQLQLDRVIFIPAAIPPHKRNAAISSGAVRLQMLALAGCTIPPFEISDLEIRRTGVSFTVDTLRALKSQASNDEFFLIVGRDNLDDLANWREPAEIARLATIVYADRVTPNASSKSMVRPVSPQLEEFNFHLQKVEMPLIEISGQDIRQRVANGRSIRFMVPDPVNLYIRDNLTYLKSQDSD